MKILLVFLFLGVIASTGGAEIEASATPYQTALATLNGTGVPQDEARAFQLFQDLAKSENAKALGMLGYLYSVGRGVGQDDTKAKHYLQSAADKGDLTAQVNLARFLIDARGGTAEPERAVALLRSATEAGSEPARLMLARVYFLGEAGQALDYSEAFKVALPAAEAGNPAAQNLVGLIVSSGQIPDQPRSTAAAWFQKSAEQEDSRAAANLGMHLLENAKDSTSRIAALKWLFASHLQKDVTATYYLEDRWKDFSDTEKDEAKQQAEELLKRIKR